MKSIIHVNQAVIKKNRKSGERKPPLTVKTYKSNEYGFEVIVNGPCRIVYRPDKPLSCGAQCWVTTDATVEVIKNAPNESLSCPTKVSQENTP